MNEEHYVTFLKPALESAYGVYTEFDACKRYQYNASTLQLLEDNIYIIKDKDDFYETVEAVYETFGCFFCYVSDNIEKVRVYRDKVNNISSGVTNIDVIWLRIHKEDNIPISVGGYTPYTMLLRNGVEIEGVGKTKMLWNKSFCNYVLINSLANDIEHDDSRISTEYVRRVCNAMKESDISMLPYVLHNRNEEKFNNCKAFVFFMKNNLYTVTYNKCYEDTVMLYRENNRFLDYAKVFIYWEDVPALCDVRIIRLDMSDGASYKMNITGINDIAEMYQKLYSLGGIYKIIRR